MALAAWRFLGGWVPERLGIYLACQDVEDVSLLMEQLVVIRDVVEGAGKA